MRARKLLFLAGALILFAFIMRLLPHEPNVTPIAALAFLAARYINYTWAILCPLSALFISDVIIGFYDWRLMVVVYGAFLMIAIISRLTTRNSSIFVTTGLVATGSILFFLITNFAVWLFSSWYEKSLTGLLYAYELGLPFLRNMLQGDVLYTLGLIAVIETTLYLVKKIKYQQEGFVSTNQLNSKALV